MGVLILASFLSSAPFQADDLEQRLKKLVTPLGSENPAEREAARVELIRLVARDRKRMRVLLSDLLEEQKDVEVRTAFLQGLAKTHSLEDLSLEVVFPKDALTVREAGSSNTRFRIRLRNDDDSELTVIRNLKLEVLDPDGNPLKTSTYIGAGLRPNGCFLAAAPFLTIPGGHVMEWDEGLSAYRGEMRVFQGYEPSRPGIHTLRFTLGFDRAAFKRTCRDGCAGHDLAGQPWNRALEGSRTFEVKLSLRDETPEEQAARAAHEKWMDDLMVKYRAGKLDLSRLYEAIDKAKLDYRDRQRVLSVTRE